MAGSSAASNDGFIEPLTQREMEILRLMVAGKSNREISIQLYLSEGTVKWHNKHIFDKLGVRSRAEAIALIHKLQLFQQPATTPPPKLKQNLPSQPTIFIGRENEIQEIISRIQHPDCRLLSLIGVGGSGKTRLAVQAASQLLSDFRDGVFFTPLEPISSPDQVMPAIAQACRLHFYEGADPRQQVFDFLQSKEVMLVLDNFEHLLEAKSEVLALLEHAHHVRMIVTSRIPLHLMGEWVQPITGMTFPADALQDGEEFDAVQLFLACAKRSGRMISPSTDLSHIVTICQLTQGMPLAIELAASWLRTLTCQEIAENLKQDFDLLETPLNDLPERHQSIRRVFNHSWSLLAENDRQILRAISVFRGGFTSAALNAVTGAALTDLARLIDTSLIQVTGNGRYDLHPLIAQFLHEHLMASGEHPAISTAHATYYAEFLQVRRDDLKGGRQLAALNEIQADFENISAAWIWLIDHEDYANLEKAWEALLLYVNIRGGENLFNYPRKLPFTADQSQPTLAYLNCCFFDPIEADVRRIQAIADQHQDQRVRAFALREIADNFAFRHEYAACLRVLAESLSLFQELGEDYYVASVLMKIGSAYGFAGEQAKCNEYLERSLHIFRLLDNHIGISGCLHDLASQMFFAGNYALAEPQVHEAMNINQEFGNQGGALFCTQFLGHLHVLRGDFDAAWGFYHATLAIAEDIGGVWPKAFVNLLGIEAAFEGNYLKADGLFAKSRAIFGFHLYEMMLIDWGQSIVKCRLGRWQLAQEYLLGALKMAFTRNLITFMLMSLPPAALILWNANKKSLAVEMMALAFTHPKSEQGWFVKSPFGNGAIERMKSEMDEREFDEAWQRGAQRDLHETAVEILTMFADAD